MLADMGSRPVARLLFKQGYGVTGPGQMQGAFAPGKTAAHHCYGHNLHIFSLPRSLKEIPPDGKPARSLRNKKRPDTSGR